MHEEGRSVDHRKIRTAFQQKRIGRAEGAAGLDRDRSQPTKCGSVDMAAENRQRQSVHRLERTEKRTAVPASDLVQRLDANPEWRLMHEQKGGCRHVGKRAHQSWQMRPDVAVALAGDGHIDTEEG